MNRNRLIMIGVVALALSGVLLLLIYRFLRLTTAANRGTPMATVVAAATDLPVGTRLEEKDVRLVKMPQSDLPPGTYYSAQEVVGRGVIVPITKNDLVLSSKLAAENAGAGLPGLIGQGLRAVSVKVNDVISVAGFVTPGTRVDVLLTGSPTRETDPGSIMTTTVLQNIQVLAAGQRLQRNEKGEPQTVTVITLLVNPEDAQKLTLASSEGRIQLSLRNPLDTTNEVVPILRNATLYRLQPSGAAPEHPQRRREFAKVVPHPTPTAPAPYMVEMIRGEKRDVAKF